MLRLSLTDVEGVYCVERTVQHPTAAEYHRRKIVAPHNRDQVGCAGRVDLSVYRMGENIRQKFSCNRSQIDR